LFSCELPELLSNIKHLFNENKNDKLEKEKLFEFESLLGEKIFDYTSP
jgi:hypothetical protein